MEKVVAVQDDDMHWYVIPAHMKDEFYKMEEEGERDDWTAFMDKFSQYQTGGDLNLTQLYADL